MNKKPLIIISITALFLLIAIGITYAYFTANISGNESSTTINIGGGVLSLTVNGGNNIEVNNTYPQASAIVTKTITLTGSNSTALIMPYTLALVIDSNTFSSNVIKYTLDSNNTDFNGSIVPSIIIQTGIPISNSSIVLGSGSFTNGINKVHTYVLKLYFPDSGSNQNVEQGKSLTAHINITSSEAFVPTLGNLILGPENVNVTSTLTTPGREVSTNEEAVLASTTDDYGTSYYYRGNVNNNYVVFANMCWRVVRITGNGAIKIVLYNYNPNLVANPCDTSEDGVNYAFARYSGTTFTSAFNSSFNDNRYIGFMYGTISASYNTTHANINKSTILTNLEVWYTNNLSSYTSSLADTIWCNDKSMSTDSAYLGYQTNTTYYKAAQRLDDFGTSAPSLVCPNDNSGGKLSKFTVSDATNGNANLTYKIGLLTADEMAFAGGIWNTNNITYYIYKNASSNTWWSMSPYYLSSGSACMFGLNADMSFFRITVNNSVAVRPAVSLISTATVIGSGTSSNPYIVQ